MPICEITYPRELLTEDEKTIIANRITEFLIEAEGLQDNPVSRAISLVTVNESESVFIGGMPSNQGKILVKIHAFIDAFSDDQKKAIYSKITKIFIEEHEGTKMLQGNNVWCLIFPVSSNNFGVGSMPVSLEMMRNIVASHGKDE